MYRFSRHLKRSLLEIFDEQVEELLTEDQTEEMLENLENLVKHGLRPLLNVLSFENRQKSLDSFVLHSILRGIK